MKIKVLLLALGCSMMSFGAYAQKGVDTGTPFGSGEDSVRCITNISLFVPYAKAGNFKDAYEFWYQAYFYSFPSILAYVRELIRISTCMV